MLGALVRSWGFEPVLARDGTSALAILRGGCPPSAAILDWMMPGMSGVDIVRALDEDAPRAGRDHARAKIVLLTAKGGGADVAEALSAGADDYVAKPFDPLVLRARLEATLRRGKLAPQRLEPGTVLDGRYRLEERIGAGGMGAVFRATHLALQTTVAVKIVRLDRPDLPQVRERFEREAQTAASVRSEHVARILDYGVTPSGQPYLVMEHLRGQTLEERLERLGPLEVADAVRVIRGVAQGLEAAHRLGLVHRDVKPGNIFLADPEEGGLPVAKLIDFGLAKGTDPGGVTMTGQGEIVGTVGFMSPSQLLGEQATVDCDLWALAATAVAALIGRSPFEEEIQSLTILNTLQAPPPQLSMLREGLPRALDAWAETAFSRVETERFGSASELAYTFSVAATSGSHFSQ